ncbi:MAG TPA: hypothetical protein VMR62_15835 [Bryobacteraceae bacterium]|nr:hypothetical protein [Bryobacteraceae bacterium]
MQDGFKPREAIGVVRGFERNAAAAETPQRIPARLGGIDAACQIIRRASFDVIAQLFGDLVAKPCPAKNAGHTMEPCHACRSYVYCNTRATAPVKAAQLFSSSANCRRPAAVI